MRMHNPRMKWPYGPKGSYGSERGKPVLVNLNYQSAGPSRRTVFEWVDTRSRKLQDLYKRTGQVVVRGGQPIGIVTGYNPDGTAQVQMSGFVENVIVDSQPIDRALGRVIAKKQFEMNEMMFSGESIWNRLMGG